MVTAPLEMRIKRVMQRDGITRAEVESRNARQFTEEKKIQLADYVVKNDDTELVIPQVLKLHDAFMALVDEYWLKPYNWRLIINRLLLHNTFYIDKSAV